MATSALKQESTHTAAGTKSGENLHFVIDRALLLKSLGHVQSVVERRGTIPILANVKLETSGNSLNLTATDMDIAVEDEVPAQVQVEGATTVPAHMLYDIVRKLPDGAQVEIIREAGDGSKVRIHAGPSKFALSCLPVDDFPAMSGGDLEYNFTLAGSDCQMLIDKARFAVSTEETRYYLNGIYLHAAENDGNQVLRAVATDGHRLARIEVPLPTGAAGMPGVIVPRKTIGELKKLIEEKVEEVGIALSDTKIRFTCGNTILTSKLIDGTFPDYDRVIPTANDKLMEVDGKAFADAVDRVSVISSEKSRGVKFSIAPGKLILSASSPEQGTASEELEVTYSADALETGFNSRYLLDMMAQIEGDTVQFVLAEASSPALVRDSANVAALYVIMPMRV